MPFNYDTTILDSVIAFATANGQDVNTTDQAEILIDTHVDSVMMTEKMTGPDARRYVLTNVAYHGPSVLFPARVG